MCADKRDDPRVGGSKQADGTVGKEDHDGPVRQMVMLGGKEG